MEYSYEDIKEMTRDKTIAVTLSLKRCDLQNDIIRKKFKVFITKRFIAPPGMIQYKPQKYEYMIRVLNAKGFPFNFENADTFIESIDWNPYLKYWSIGDCDYYVKLKK